MGTLTVEDGPAGVSTRTTRVTFGLFTSTRVMMCGMFGRSVVYVTDWFVLGVTCVPGAGLVIVTVRMGLERRDISRSLSGTFLEDRDFLLRFGLDRMTA